MPGVGPETPADHDYEGGFAAALMLKDLKLAADAARSVGAYTPMGGEAEELYQRFVDRGGGSKDFSGIIKMIDDSWKVPARSNRMTSCVICSCLPQPRSLAPAAGACAVAAISRRRRKALAIMHERHEGMEAIGKANKALHRELDAAAPDVGGRPRHLRA